MEIIDEAVVVGTGVSNIFTSDHDVKAIAHRLRVKTFSTKEIEIKDCTKRKKF